MIDRTWKNEDFQDLCDQLKASRPISHSMGTKLAPFGARVNNQASQKTGKESTMLVYLFVYNILHLQRSD